MCKQRQNETQKENPLSSCLMGKTSKLFNYMKWHWDLKYADNKNNFVFQVLLFLILFLWEAGKLLVILLM